jgi:hypothetical protein
MCLPIGRLRPCRVRGKTKGPAADLAWKRTLDFFKRYVA